MTGVRDYLLRIAYLRKERHFPYRDYHKRHRCVFIHVPKTGGTSILTALGHGRARGAGAGRGGEAGAGRGGRWPGPAARTAGRDHLPWFVYWTANPEYYARAFSFAFVRNPWDRAVSAYRYLWRGGSGEEAAEDVRMIRSYESFSDFVVEGLAQGYFRSHLLFLPQAYFVLGAGGEPKVDFVGRFERLEEDWGSVAARLGLGAELPRENMGVGDEAVGGAAGGGAVGSAAGGGAVGGAAGGGAVGSAAAGPRAYRAAYEDRAAVDVIAEVYREDVRAFGYTF